MKLCLGLVGKPLAGKESVGEFLMPRLKKLGYTSSRHRFRDVLEETLNRLKMAQEENYLNHKVLKEIFLKGVLALWSLNEDEMNLQKLWTVLSDESLCGPGNQAVVERASLQKLAQLMVRPESFGPSALSNAVYNRFLKDDVDVIIADGVRWLADEKLMRSLPDNHGRILYIAADFEVRLKRAQSRKREGEEKITREEFLRQDNALNESYIDEIGSRADWSLENNSDILEELEEKTERFLWTELRPLI